MIVPSFLNKARGAALLRGSVVSFVRLLAKTKSLFLTRPLPGVITLCLIALALTGCKSNHAQNKNNSLTDSGAASSAAHNQGKMAMDCTLCKEPSRAGLLMAGAGASDDLSASKDQSAGHGMDSAKMVLIQGGSFQMGSDQFGDAQPVHKVTVSAFYMDAHEVTNDQFAKFVDATHYITVAERPLNPKDYPGVPVDKLVPGSGVFTPPSRPVPLNNPMAWWSYVPGANWRHPLGPGSSIQGKGNYPVVQVCYEDCVAYANWAGKRLPTEAEWEFAARAGQHYEDYYWGKSLHPDGKYMANNFQGHFPDHNTKADGYDMLAPIEQYPVSRYGLYDMEGNAWEWCSDFYRPDYYAHSPEKNPQGPKDSYDPEEPGQVKRVQRGGSFLCSDEYCIRYKAGSRGKGEPGSASNNLGFRLVRSK
ncbi:Formylglycine-generating enzyme, required for sulfatase activity, contains SUMF1/FGE domain [Arachidicoccus rhizosphaerae]|uniref:Formylglycine-generating enzyme, required for sulfatase activity, contains SUMF1/FGE domain n=1 Tax=Arachidicoccus rhizosphaerae TaxID=551991 RepID=A0A1H4BUA5_9BACT|nr:formylglycine-generating enzyme family protein [Arachidicoccus rhizosphaerae]SEA51670.1 Formylglycine-generating enzyme, required for sulfatase activity, contains SUMF1/FGE domain [Arachidicoccus rhizosphaerae]